jgi:hypothetical protein
MRLLVFLGLLFGVVGTFAAAKTQERPKEGAHEKALELTIRSDKSRYKLKDKIRIDVTLTNKHPARDIFVYGTLKWGYRASLTENISDSSGKRVSPKIISEDLTPPISRNDMSLFVKLLPKHFLGTYLAEEIDQLKLSKPGKYSIVVEYHCPIAEEDVDLAGFWSREDGVIRSNIVWIEVIS